MRATLFTLRSHFVTTALALLFSWHYRRLGTRRLWATWQAARKAA